MFYATFIWTSNIKQLALAFNLKYFFRIVYWRFNK